MIESSADQVWSVIGDFGAGPARMAPGLVLESHLDGDCRIVSFADGTVARERFVSVDDDARRIVCSVVGETLHPEHNNTSMQVVGDGEGRCRLVWIHDVLPDDLAAPLESTMTQVMAAIKQTLQSQPVPH